ncbi:MAG TPA: ATP-binding cassette domain-containing protein, partial [Candidatus Manganitrophaceae bacterium]|nr:ATP-binding cassette domain-containing protein [Candidatus Manganitrophaceae bacterium]
MAEVRLQSIAKRFKENEILKGIDLTIAHGEFFTLAGPSGCGKSTLLNLIAGLEPPTSGKI